MQIIPEKWQNRWSSEEIRVLVLSSLAIQIGLIFLAPLRKRSANKIIAFTLWILYLEADYVATLALGYVLSKQIDGAKGELTALWAPFLLLHLGGPDAITSYTIEDNELWWRHLLMLVVQVGTGAVTFLQSPPDPWLWTPTILVFVPGLIKVLERTFALRSGSKDYLKDKIISESCPSYPDELDFGDTSILDNEIFAVKEGYGWLNIFKRLLVDVTFSSDVLMNSQRRFSGIDATEAFKLVAIELSFLYDTLHTKAVHIHCISGRVLRCSSLISITAALIAFDRLHKKTYVLADIRVTYILFGAALSIEVISVLLLVFSDWTVLSISSYKCCKHFADTISL